MIIIMKDTYLNLEKSKNSLTNQTNEQENATNCKNTVSKVH